MARDQRRRNAIEVGLHLLSLPVTEFHEDYVAIGGTLPLSTICAFIDGAGDLNVMEYDRLASVLNARFEARSMGRPIPWSEDFR